VAKKKVETSPFTAAALVVHNPVLVPVGKLNPALYNPRRIKDREFDALKESIVNNGFVEPLVVRREGMQIIGGHQRLRALKELCEQRLQPLPKVPCVVLDLDDRQAKMLNIALNKIGGDFDEPKLASVIESIMAESPHERCRDTCDRVPKLGD
jgi:ParB-like chromosome segregation protein Spo0J